jgi:hypothetical protein
MTCHRNPSPTNKEVIFETALAAISADELGGSRYIFPGPDYLAYNSHDKTNRCTKIKIFYFICWFYNVNFWLMHGYE